jgi:hypothetical protein
MLPGEAGSSTCGGVTLFGAGNPVKHAAVDHFSFGLNHPIGKPADNGSNGEPYYEIDQVHSLPPFSGCVKKSM